MEIVPLEAWSELDSSSPQTPTKPQPQTQASDNSKTSTQVRQSHIEINIGENGETRIKGSSENVAELESLISQTLDSAHSRNVKHLNFLAGSNTGVVEASLFKISVLGVTAFLIFLVLKMSSGPAAQVYTEPYPKTTPVNYPDCPTQTY